MSGNGVPEHVLVVGGGLGAVRVTDQLRSRGFSGALTVLGREEHLPYDRPPLSKQILSGGWEPERTRLRDREALAERNIELRTGAEVTGVLDGQVMLADDQVIDADAIVVATGVVPIELPDQPSGVLTLRSLDDAIALRDSLPNIGALLIVGAGFIGAEVAWAARSAGVEVTVLEAQSVPCERALGLAAGSAAAQLFREAGVDLRCGVRLAGFVDDRTVLLADGSTLSADLILVSVGARPELDWIGASGLAVGAGLLCDARGRAQGGQKIWGVGDVAAWWDKVRARHLRAEHWTNVGDQAAVVACDILGVDLPPATVPYIWSDQFGLKVQVVGSTDLADRVVPLRGEGLSGGAVKGSVLGYFRGDQLVGAVGFGAPAQLAPLRQLVAQEADESEVRARIGP